MYCPECDKKMTLAKEKTTLYNVEDNIWIIRMIGTCKECDMVTCFSMKGTIEFE